MIALASRIMRGLASALVSLMHLLLALFLFLVLVSSLAYAGLYIHMSAYAWLLKAVCHG